VLFNEPKLLKLPARPGRSDARNVDLSVLFNEPKLLKYSMMSVTALYDIAFSALQRAEIAEMLLMIVLNESDPAFQCSSTSRNC